MRYGRYVYMTSKSSDCFWYPGSACSMLVSCIWYRDQRKLWSLQASRRKTRLECRLRSASAQINWKTYGWLGQPEYRAQNLILIRKWSVNLVRHLTLCAFASIDDGDLILWQVLKLIARQLWSLASHKHHQWWPLAPLPYHPLVRSFKYIGSSDGALDAPTP